MTCDNAVLSGFRKAGPLKILLILILFLGGCKVIEHRGDIYTYDANDKLTSHVKVTLSKPMRFSAKQDEKGMWTVVADSKKESLVGDIIKIYTLKAIEGD